MPDTFAGRLKKLRKKHGFTQAQLGQELGVGDSAVRMWECGRNYPNHEALISLAQIFQVSIDYLMGLSAICQPADSAGQDAALIALSERPALRTLLELAETATDADLDTINRTMRAFLRR